MAVTDYPRYHWRMQDMGDIDPAYPLLCYVCERFDLHPEQRYWLAFLYGLTYCGPSAYYVYHEFPDLGRVDLGRMQRWWHSAGRERTVFQTDRRWLRSRNQFVPAVASYLRTLGGLPQAHWFGQWRTPNPFLTYDVLTQACSHVFQMGRFARFNWLEAVQVVTGLPMQPRTLDLREAESCRNGLAYAVDRPDLLTGRGARRQTLTNAEHAWLQRQFGRLLGDLQAAAHARRVDVWTMETTLCAYKKFKRGQRYPGYYLDRQAEEIATCAVQVPEGVHWGVLWDFRRETFAAGVLVEAGAQNAVRAQAILEA